MEELGDSEPQQKVRTRLADESQATEVAFDELSVQAGG